MPDGEIREAPLKDIRESGEDQEEENGYEELPLPEDDRKTDRGEFGDQLDLHYEALIQNHTPTPGKSILEFQLEICRQFILESIQRKRPHIRIIHGRGSGVLKKEVEALLKNHPEVSIISFNPFSASVDVVLS